MIRSGWILLLLGALAWGQGGTPAAPNPAQRPDTPSDTPAASPSLTAEPEVAPDAAVITIQGSCLTPPADKNNDKSNANCKTVVTRAEFDRLVQLIAPKLPPTARRQLANQYAGLLVIANEAHKRGLDETPRFQLQRLELLTKELDSQLQTDAQQVPEPDLQAYYKAHEPTYQEADLQRISLPLRKQLEPAKEKLSDEETRKREQDAQDAMKKEAELIRARAAAGEDFDKLQQEVYTFAGLKISAPSTKMMKVRRTSLPSDAGSVFDLKTGEVSQVITAPTGYLIYKVGEKDTIPFEKARPEITAVLSKQRIQDLRQAILQSATTSLNAAYFPEPAAAPAQSGPGGQATPKPPATGPK